MSNMLALVATLGLGLALGAVGCWMYHRAEAPREIVRTDTVHVDRPLLKRDTVTVTKPVERLIYQTVTDTVREYVTLPRGFRPGGIIGRQPLRVTPQTITLTYWQPEARRFEQAVYDVPRPRFKLWLEPELAFTPVGTMLTAPLGFTWSRLSGWGGLAAVGGGYSGGPQHLTLGWAAGLSYRFTLFER